MISYSNAAVVLGKERAEEISRKKELVQEIMRNSGRLERPLFFVRLLGATEAKILSICRKSNYIGACKKTSKNLYNAGMPKQSSMFGERNDCVLNSLLDVVDKETYDAIIERMAIVGRTTVSEVDLKNIDHYSANQFCITEPISKDIFMRHFMPLEKNEDNSDRLELFHMWLYEMCYNEDSGIHPAVDDHFVTLINLPHHTMTGIITVENGSVTKFRSLDRHRYDFDSLHYLEDLDSLVMIGNSITEEDSSFFFTVASIPNTRVLDDIQEDRNCLSRSHSLPCVSPKASLLAKAPLEKRRASTCSMNAKITHKVYKAALPENSTASLGKGKLSFFEQKSRPEKETGASAELHKKIQRGRSSGRGSVRRGKRSSREPHIEGGARLKSKRKKLSKRRSTRRARSTSS